MKRSIGVFCVFLQVDFVKMKQNEDRVLRGVSQKTCKKLQKTPLFEERKRWKTCHFGSFWTFIERKNFFILGWFLEISLEIFQLFSHFNYLRAHKLFFGDQIHLFPHFGGRSQSRSTKSQKLKLCNTDGRVTRNEWFPSLFSLFWKNGSEMIKNSETALTTAFLDDEKVGFLTILSIDSKKSKFSPTR